MKVIVSILKQCLAKLWMVGIVLLILTALLVSALRGALPYLNQYQPQVSQYLQDQYQIHISVDEVQGVWQNGGPLLTLNKVEFNNMARLGVDLSVDKIRLQLNLVASIRALAPRFNMIELQQPQLLLGKFTPQADERSNEPPQDLVARWINSIKDIEIKDASLSFTANFSDSATKLPTINIAKIHWLGGDKQRQLQVYLKGQSDKPQPLSILVDVYGQQQSDLHGRIYIKAQQWQWLDDFRALQPQLVDSAKASASFELWSEFSNSQLQQALLVIGDNELSWLANEKNQSFTLQQAQLQWRSNNSGWLLATHSLTASINNKQLLPLNLSVTQYQGQLTAKIDQLATSNIAKLAGLFKPVSDANVSLISQLKPRGLLHNLQLQQVNDDWHYQGSISDYAQRRVGGIPAVSGVNGTFSGVNQEGNLKINLTNKQLDFGPYFSAPIKLSTLSNELFWGADQQRFWLGSSELTVKNKDLDAQLAWQLIFEQDQAPILSLAGGIKINNFARIKNYLPHKVLSKSLIDYLSTALKGGRSDDIELLWQGPLGKFPYLDNDGVFAVSAKVKRAKFKFHPKWRPLALDAQLDLLNESISISSTKGKIKNLRFNHLSAKIDNLMVNPQIDVAIDLAQSQRQISDFVLTSPIKKTLGSVLRELEVSGKINAVLNIAVPLNGNLPVVSGEIRLKNNDIKIKSIAVSVNDVQGNIGFLNGDISAKNIKAILYEQPIKFDITSKPVGDDYGVEVDLSAKWHSNKIPQNWHAYLDKYMTGSLDWQGKITLKVTEQDVFYQANLKSPMQGLALKLPKPLDKYVDQQEALRITTTGNSQGGLFNLSLGSRAEIIAKYKTLDGKVVVPQMGLLVGRGFTGQDSLLNDGLSIKVDLATLELDEWQAFISGIEKNQSDSDFLPPLSQVSANVAELTVLGQRLTDVTVTGEKLDGFWSVSFDSVQAKGQLNVFDDFLVSGVNVNFERLLISKSTGKGGSGMTLETLKSLPPIRFTCQQCDIVDMNFGKVSFNTQPHKQGLEIFDLLVDADKTKIKGHAIWGFDYFGEFSKITGSFDSENIETSLAIFNFSSAMRDSDAKAQFDLLWRDSIYAPTLATLNGSVNWEFGEGHISEISDQGARIFSLFSLDSLRRKLVLDFRDVFVKGIFYNDFKGSFNIIDGTAVTEDAYMDGIAGGVNVLGSINLVSEEIDYYVTFSPRLFSNIPVIAGVLTSTPQIFVLAFAITKVLEPIIDVVSQVNFKVTGTIEDSEFVEINRKQKKYIVPEHMLPKIADDGPSSPAVKMDNNKSPDELSKPRNQDEQSKTTTRRNPVSF